MTNERRDHTQDQLEEHSLPGTNQAGKKLPSLEETDCAATEDDKSEHREQLEEHSLPGTNQAGKPIVKPE